jgi:hypothetical protein
MRFQRFLYQSAFSLGLSGTALVACSPEAPEVPEENVPRAGRGGSSNAGAGGSIAPGTGGTASPGTGGTASPGTGGTASPGTGGTASPGTGGTSSPGTGGSAGITNYCGMAAGVAADKLIDDLEDGDNTIGNGVGQPTPPARLGYWFTYNEESASCMQSPAPDPEGLLPFPPSPMPGNGSMFGARTSGTGCTSIWGAGLGVDFNNCNLKSNAYDASAYTGISFWYKSKSPIRVLVGTKPNLPMADGGMCTSECFNHHGKNFATSTAGTIATITWAELSGTAQIGSPPADPQTYGTKRGFNPAQLLNLQVQVDQAGGGNFEIWVDDLEFL